MFAAQVAGWVKANYRNAWRFDEIIPDRNYVNARLHAKIGEQGKTHHMAIRALAFKWIRIMYRCWQDRAVYDEVNYLQALKRSNSPLLKFI